MLVQIKLSSRKLLLSTAMLVVSFSQSTLSQTISDGISSAYPTPKKYNQTNITIGDGQGEVNYQKLIATDAGFLIGFENLEDNANIIIDFKNNLNVTLQEGSQAAGFTAIRLAQSDVVLGLLGGKDFNINGVNSNGVCAHGENSTINNSVSITASGQTSKGICGTAQNTQITNYSNGSVITTGQSSRAISVSGSNSKVNNNVGGTVTASGDSSRAIVAAQEAVINNGGSIIAGNGDTNDINAIGIYLNSDSTINNNNGAITANGQYSHAIFVSGSNSRVNNNEGGTITATGDSSRAIVADQGAVINNKVGATIIAGNGDDEGAIGIYLDSDSAKSIIYNKGDITARGSLDARAIFLAGNGGTVNNNEGGNIMVDGERFYGVHMSGSNNKVNNNNGGAITANGKSSYAIFASGSNSEVNNNVGGTVTATGESSRAIVAAQEAVINNKVGATIIAGNENANDINAIGIYLDSDSAKSIINNKGDIAARGSVDARAIFLAGNGGTVNNNNGGAITANGQYSRAISVSGLNGKVNNNDGGVIAATGQYSRAIVADQGAVINNKVGSIIAGNENANDINAIGIYLNSDSTISNKEGAITATGEYSRTISVSGLNNEVNNDGGDITANGKDSSAIYFFGSNIEVNNNNGGNITATGQSSRAISMRGSDGKVNNNGGSIIAGNENANDINAIGIYLNSDSTISNKEGAITANGQYSRAISVSGSNNKVNNNDGGDIAANGKDSRAIYFFGSNSEVNNNEGGNITANGKSSHAISVSGLNSKVNNNEGGTITATGESSRAIVADQEVVINNGGSIIAGNGDDEGAIGIDLDSDSAKSIINNKGDIAARGSVDARAIFLAGNGGTVNNNEGGNITADGERFYGVHMSGSNNKVNNNNGGAITANGKSSYAIFASGSNSEVNNNVGGTVTATGDSSRAIMVFQEAVINNGGSIAAGNEGDEGAIGIYLDSNSAKSIINNKGGITVRGSVDARAIFLAGNGGTVNNNAGGNITAGGEGFYGIHMSGSNNEVNNDGGIIAADGKSSRAISVLGSNSEVNNDGGVIVADGKSSRAISVSGSNSKVNNNDGGRIKATGQYSRAIMVFQEVVINNKVGATIIAGNEDGIDEGAVGIYLTKAATNSSVINSGSIVAKGSLNAYGICSNAGDTSVTNDGSITVSGANSRAICGGEDVTSLNITNNGEINVVGSDSIGLFIQSGDDNSKTSNNGNINISGADACAIKSSGNKSVVSNSGNINATDGASAYCGTGDNQTLNINGGSIVGDIIFDSDNDNDSINVDLTDLGSETLQSVVNAQKVENLNITNSSPTKTLSIKPNNFDTVNISNPNNIAMLNSNNEVIAFIDLTSQFAQRNLLQESNDNIHNIVNKEIRRGFKVGANIWGNSFGSRISRDQDVDNGEVILSHNSDYYGLIFGQDIDFGNLHFGRYFGGHQSKIATEEKSTETKTNTGFVGGYVAYETNDWSVNGSVNLGYQDNNSKRYITSNNGQEIANSNYNSYYVSPAVRFEYRYRMENFDIRPSAKMSYNYAMYGGYSETGATDSNLEFDTRNVSTFGANAQIGLVKKFENHSEAELYVGVKNRQYSQDQTKITLNKTSDTFNIQEENTNIGYYAGVNVDYQLEDFVSLDVDFEYSQMSEMENSMSGNIGINFEF